MCVAAPVIAAAAAVVSAVVSAAGTGVAVSAQAKAADQAKEQADYQRQLALYDAIAKKNAGQVEQVKLGIAQRREFGARRAQLAASSADLSYGNPTRSLEETRQFHAIDGLLLAETVRASVLSAKVSGDVASYNGKVQATNFRYQAAASGIRGAASLASSIGSFYNSGIFNNNNNNTNTEADTGFLSPDPSTVPSARRLQYVDRYAS